MTPLLEAKSLLLLCNLRVRQQLCSAAPCNLSLLRMGVQLVPGQVLAACQSAACALQVLWALIAVKNSSSQERCKAGTRIFDQVRKQATAGSLARMVVEELPAVVDQLISCANFDSNKAS